MKTLNNVVFAALLGLTFATAGSAVHAQDAATTRAAMTDGEIKKVDKDAKKLTIKHGELKNLGMPGMTMVFKVQDAAMLDKVKQGDKVRFSADKVDGALTVTSIEAAK
ncbi:copper-binding protein [Pseudoduganella sp. UC29_106]|uniref:copper-binding protein n=1 Tax=Pseudoduganella sp. UC29_106 TaxID=3374553 RepID=UPI0037575F04